MTETITIERMGAGSEAVGRTAEGKAVFVAGAAPGDVVEADLVEDRGRYARARLVRVVEASPDRVEPTCAAAGACGGCPWQHLSYGAQLAAKRANVVAVLARTARLGAARAEETVADPVPSKRQWGYRNKLEFGCSRASGRFDVGFRRKGTHEVATPADCPAAVRPLARAAKALQGALRYAQGSSDLGIYRVGVRGSLRTRDVEAALWTAPGAFPRAHVAKTVESALRATGVVRVLANPGKARTVKGIEVLSGRPRWRERLHSALFETTAPSFFQVNTVQAERLVAEVERALGDLSGMFVADLYAGGGTFSIPLARAGADVAAIEYAGTAVRDLRRNADANDAAIEVVGGDAARELSALGAIDAAVVDPPRSGLDARVVAGLAEAGPARVAYVSCNPATWARDVARLEDAGFRLVRAVPVDLFPQTPHIEVASCFVRR